MIVVSPKEIVRHFKLQSDFRDIAIWGKWMNQKKRWQLSINSFPEKKFNKIGSRKKKKNYDYKSY